MRSFLIFVFNGILIWLLLSLGIFVIYVLDLRTIFMFKHGISTLGLSAVHFFLKKMSDHARVCAFELDHAIPGLIPGQTECSF